MLPADIIARLKSRKFWVTVAVGVVLVFGEELGLNLSEDTLWQLVALVGGWLGIQGIIDYKNGARS